MATIPWADVSANPSDYYDSEHFAMPAKLQPPELWSSTQVIAMAEHLSARDVDDPFVFRPKEAIGERSSERQANEETMRTAGDEDLDDDPTKFEELAIDAENVISEVLDLEQHSGSVSNDVALSVEISVGTGLDEMTRETVQEVIEERDALGDGNAPEDPYGQESERSETAVKKSKKTRRAGKKVPDQEGSDAGASAQVEERSGLRTRSQIAKENHLADGGGIVTRGTKRKAGNTQEASAK
jgi:hypothetical protein